MRPTAKPARFAIVGCYTTVDRRGRGRGVEVFDIDPATQAWTPKATTPLVNPSYLALDRSNRTLFVAHGATPQVSSHRLDPTDGTLALLSQRSAGGTNPVHIGLSADERFLLCANYTSGELATLPIDAHGILGDVISTLKIEGAPGPVAAEQRGPHPHHVPFDPSGRWVVIPDKGLDQIAVARFDRQTGALALASIAKTAPGSGPRHVCFHPALPLAYVNNELDATASVYSFDQETGALTLRQTLSTIPACYSGWNATGEIVLSPSGTRLFVSNRGHDSVVEFGVDPQTGRLDTDARWRPSGGASPRFMSLDPQGGRLYVANQDGDDICAIPLTDCDALGNPERVIETPSPACILFI